MLRHLRQPTQVSFPVSQKYGPWVKLHFYSKWYLSFIFIEDVGVMFKKGAVPLFTRKFPLIGLSIFDESTPVVHGLAPYCRRVNDDAFHVSSDAMCLASEHWVWPFVDLLSDTSLTKIWHRAFPLRLASDSCASWRHVTYRSLQVVHVPTSQERYQLTSGGASSQRGAGTIMVPKSTNIGSSLAGRRGQEYLIPRLMKVILFSGFQFRRYI